MTDKISLKENNKGLSSYQLKLIGIIFMVLDHIHQMFTPIGAPMWLTMAGRIVAPIFLYLSAQGFKYTRSRKNYMKRLWIASVLMSIGNILISDLLPMEDVVIMNSMFGTLFLTVFYTYVIISLKDNIRSKNIKGIVLNILGLVLPFILGTIVMMSATLNINLFRALMVLIPSPFLVEGGVVWILLGVVFYLLIDKDKWIQVLPIILISLLLFINGDRVQPFMIFSVIPIYLYNGKIGKKSSKYFFYFFYPIHIYILYALAYVVKVKMP